MRDFNPEWEGPGDPLYLGGDATFGQLQPMVQEKLILAGLDSPANWSPDLGWYSGSAH